MLSTERERLIEMYIYFILIFFLLSGCAKICAPGLDKAKAELCNNSQMIYDADKNVCRSVQLSPRDVRSK